MAAPTISITVDKTALKIGDAANVTFTFSTAPVGFTLGDVSVSNGALSGLTATGDPLVYTALFSPTPGVAGAQAVLSVGGGTYEDTFGAPGTGGSSPAITIDTLAPTVSITSSTSALRSGETATLTFTFSEAVTGFGLGDLSATGGTLSDFTTTANPLVYRAVFTPNGGLSGAQGSVSLAAGSYADIAGNNGGGGSGPMIAVNTLGPSVGITTSHGTLKAGESALITFTFSSPPTGFTAGDIVVSGGTLSGLTNLGGGIYEANFTPSSGVDAGVGSVSVASGSYTDGLGNAGGSASVAPISFDTRAPTVSIALADPALGIGQTSEVTFTFSEAVTGFTGADLTTPNGNVSGLSSTDGGITWKGLLTPTPGVTDTSNIITVDMTGVADLAGNVGIGSADSPNYVVDSQRPTATIVLSKSAFLAGETSMVTFTFSEAVTGFTAGDLSVSNGTVTELSSDGGITWTGTFTPNEHVRDVSNLITLDNTSYSDLAGNTGTAVTTSANYTIDTVRPTATIVVAAPALKLGDASEVTITFSEAVSGLNETDLTVANGAIGPLNTDDGGITWKATLTPDANVSDATNIITLDMTGVTNAIGNSGTGTAGSNNFAIDTARPTATITVASSQLQAGQTSQITIAFSEAVVNFDSADLTVANGAVSSLVSADGGKTWIGTLTPTGGVIDATNLIVLDTSLVADLAGNSGSAIAISNNYQVGYVPPSPQVSDDDVISLPAAGGSVSAGRGADSVAGAGGDDVIQGNTGDDTLTGGGGDDIVRGGQDNDFVHGNAGADLLFGDLGNDSVFGGQGDDFVQGGQGDDYVLGDLGSDTVLGGQGSDTVVGGAGDDYLSGDLGDDVLVGGAGADLFNFAGGGGRDVVMDFSHAEGDRIRISPADAANFAALSARFSEDGGNTVITLDGQTIVLAGVAKSALSAADFVFG